MKRYRVTVKYRDEMSKGEWRETELVTSAENKHVAIKEAIKIYGLDHDPTLIEYKTEVKEV